MDARESLTSPRNSAAPRSVQVYTRNITRRPIAWDPARQRPTQELVHSIHSALHFALDPCVDHPDEKPSFCITSTPSFSSSQTLPPQSESGSSRVQGGRLIIPCIQDIAHTLPTSTSGVLPSSRDKDELTVKLFAGFDGAPLTPDDIDDALLSLQRVLGPARAIDKFIVSLKGVKWTGPLSGVSRDAEDEEFRQIDAMREAWEVSNPSSWFTIRAYYDIYPLNGVYSSVSVRPAAYKRARGR